MSDSESADHWQFQPGIHLDTECKGCGKTGAILGNMCPWKREGHSEIHYCYWCKQCVEEQKSLAEYHS